MQGRMKASSHSTRKGHSESEKLQLGGVPPRVDVKQNCTEDMECHATQVLLWLINKIYAFFPHPAGFSYGGFLVEEVLMRRFSPIVCNLRSSSRIFWRSVRSG